jgi:hypothetical protein
MNRRFFSFILVLLVLGISSSTADAQRGFGGRGFGRSGPGSMKGHAPGARVFVAPQFAPNGHVLNHFGPRGNFNPFFGNVGRGFLTRINRGFPIFFFPNGLLHFNNIESGLGVGISPIATPLPPVRWSFPGVHLNELRLPIPTVIDLPPFGLNRPVKLGQVKSSRATIVFLPSDIFGAEPNRRTAGRQ